MGLKPPDPNGLDIKLGRGLSAGTIEAVEAVLLVFSRDHTMSRSMAGSRLLPARLGVFPRTMYTLQLLAWSSLEHSYLWEVPSRV